MKLILVLALVLSSLAFAQTGPGPRIMCSFENGYFRVFDGTRKFEKYVGGTAGTVECNADFGALVSGPYFTTYFQGNFTQKYIGGNGAKTFLVRGRMAVAMMGSYLIVAKAGGQIIEKYLSGNGTPVIEASSSVAIIALGSYLYGTDGNNVAEKYVGNMQNPILVTGRNLGGALVGSYLVAYNNASFSDQYIGSRGANDTLVGGRAARLLAGIVGNYFVIYDADRSSYKSTYVSSGGRVEVREEGAYLIAPNGRMTRYNLMSGSFESL